MAALTAPPDQAIGVATQGNQYCKVVRLVRDITEDHKSVLINNPVAQKEDRQRLQSSPLGADQDRRVFGTAEPQRQPPHEEYVNIYEMQPV